jgi:hypothetical protein
MCLRVCVCNFWVDVDIKCIQIQNVRQKCHVLHIKQVHLCRAAIWLYLTLFDYSCSNMLQLSMWSIVKLNREAPPRFGHQAHFKLCVTILQPSHWPHIARYGCSQLSVWCNQLDPFSGTPQWQLYAHMCVHCCSLNWNVVMSAREPRARYKKKAYHGVLLIDSNASICFSMLLHPLYNLI